MAAIRQMKPVDEIPNPNIIEPCHCENYATWPVALVAQAIADKALVEPILKDVQHLWDEHDETLKEPPTPARMAKFVNLYKSLKDALLPATYYTDGKLDSFLYEAVATIFHLGAQAMQHHNIAGAEVEMTLSSVWEAALHPPSYNSVPDIGNNPCSGCLLFTTAKISAYEEAASIANAMVMKSNCLKHRFHWLESDIVHPTTNKAVASIFKPNVLQLCGENTLDELARETYKANQELVHMLDKITDIGKCLFPLEDEKRDTRTSADVKCIETIVPVLREAHGQMGLLHGALSLAQAYAMATDSMLTKLHYGNTIPAIFNLDLPDLPPVLPALERLSNEQKPVHALSCVAMVASQRAYTASFSKLALAIPTWMRSFSRDLLEPSLGTNWYPCGKVVNNLDDPKTSMCKNKFANYPSSHPSGSAACSIAHTPVLFVGWHRLEWSLPQQKAVSDFDLNMSRVS
eukprot:3474912-Amphidinium_carterae.1